MLKPTVEALIFGRKREIGGIIPDVVVSETHTDELQVTDYPVDSGANVTDHAFKKPAIVHATFAWSDSSTLLNSVIANIKSGSFFKGISTTKDIYHALLKMQSDRVLFSLTTGKRKYENVLIESLKVTTTEKTENALVVDVVFREVILATALEVQLQRKPKNKKRAGGRKSTGARAAVPTKGGR